MVWGTLMDIKKIMDILSLYTVVFMIALMIICAIKLVFMVLSMWTIICALIPTLFIGSFIYLIRGDANHD